MRCTPGVKKSSKLVKNCKGKKVCVRYGDRNMSIKKHMPSRKKSFCARHKCKTKSDPATPGYQSCKAWNCKTAAACSRGSKSKLKKPKRSKRTPCKRGHIRSSKSGRCVKASRKTSKKPKKPSSKGSTYVSASGRRYTSCWKGYRRSGWKTRNGRRVPNCVKK